VELQEQRETSERLLLNILPVQVAKELKENGKVEPKYFEDVTIIFTDSWGSRCLRKNSRWRTW